MLLACLLVLVFLLWLASFISCALTVAGLPRYCWRPWYCRSFCIQLLSSLLLLKFVLLLVFLQLLASLLLLAALLI
jgi:hypothetical protein